MYVQFEDLPPHSRLWIYVGDRKFTREEELRIREEAKVFCEQWEAHGNPLKTSYKIERQQFLILSVDEGVAGASGCSIDGSVRMLKSLQSATGIDFLDRSKVAFLAGSEILLVSLPKLKQAFAAGILGAATPTFHVLAATKGEWMEGWIRPAEKTWLAQYLPKTPAV
jgi:hypothetical protein